jgi:hypothetical protein
MRLKDNFLFKLSFIVLLILVWFYGAIDSGAIHLGTL